MIANSLSITIAQRTREFATLRTLGASRRQVLRSIMLEALVVGALASIIGLFLGLALAKGLFSLFDAVGFTLPNSGLRSGAAHDRRLARGRHPRHAAREPAAGAARDARAADRRRARGRDAAGVALRALPHAGVDRCSTLLGFAALALGPLRAGPRDDPGPALDRRRRAPRLLRGRAALGAVRAARSPAALGWPATRLGGAAGSLARDNAQRNPQRTASTAAALMIGLALVTLVAVLAAGIISTSGAPSNDLWKNADYAITAQNNFSPIPTAAADAAAKAPGVIAVGNVRTGEARAFGKNDLRDRRRPADANDVQPRLEAGLGGRARDARRRRRLRRQRLRQEAPPRGSARRSS